MNTKVYIFYCWGRFLSNVGKMTCLSDERIVPLVSSGVEFHFFLEI